MMSKQESCHLMLGIPNVYCSHTEVNTDLRNTYNMIESKLDSSGDDNVVAMYGIDTYAKHIDPPL